MRWLGVVGVVGAVALVAAGCGSDGDANGRGAGNGSGRGHQGDGLVEVTTTSAPPGCKAEETTDAAPDTTVDVNLSEYALAPSKTTVRAGNVRFAARNVGHVAHELMVVRFDGAPGAIPLNPVGGADMSRLPDNAVAGWIRLFDPGLTCGATFTLTPGKYVLMCNAVDDGSNPHYSRGMRLAFTVS